MCRLRRGPNPEFALVAPEARLPTHGSEEAAGYDLYATRRVVVEPHIMTCVPLGIASQFNKGWVAHIWDRSGMGKKGIHIHAGVIDSDYRGEWKLMLINHTDQEYVIEKGDRAAQVVFVPCYVGPIGQVASVRTSERGTGGWGSTGR